MTRLVRVMLALAMTTVWGCAGNSDEIDGPEPAISAVSPDLLCVDQSDQEITVTGSGLAPLVTGAADQVAVELPSLVLTRTQDLDGAAVSGPELTLTEDQVEWDSQSAVRTTLTPALGMEPGVYRIRIVNGSGQEATRDGALTLVPEPEVTAVEPDLFCGADGAAELTVIGTGFVDVGGTLPTIMIDGEPYTADSVEDCTALDDSALDAQICDRLLFTLPSGELDPGWHQLSVTNPPPADCETTAAADFYVVESPVIEEVNTTEVCDQDANDFTITGTGFLELDGVAPTVTVESTPATVEEITGCTAVEGYPTARLCTSMRVTVPDGSIELGAYTVTVVNPGDYPCSDSADGYIGPPPTVSVVDPVELCPSGGEITVTGDGFWDGAVVTLVDGGTEIDLATTFVDVNTLTAIVPDTVTPGTYDVRVTNQDGCSGDLVGVLIIHEMPVVFFVDPYTLYNQVNLQVTLYTTGILGSVTDVSIYPVDDPASATSIAFNDDSVDRLQAIVPALLPAGAYGVTVTDDMGCVGSLSPAFEVVDETILALDRIELPFGWTSSHTGVDIYSPTELEDGEENFAPIPRFYLSPKDATEDTVASELSSVSYVSPTRVTAVVPEGLPIGIYNLIAVNPDGAVGYLADAFEVTELPPPEVHTLTPASIINQDVQSITLEGENFRNPTVEVTCLEPDDGTPTLVGTITSSDDTSIVLEFDFETQTIDDGAVCTIKVINDDLTYDVYAALGITNPSLNLENFQPAGTLNTARRALCSVAGEAVPAARFIYALGGDDGTTRDTDATTYYDTVEMAPISAYGELGGFDTLRFRLPAPRSFQACTTIDRYVYVAGGTQGDGAESSVWRAKILDPAEAPDIVDVALDVDQNQAATLAAGRYSYRVAAVFPSDYDENPSGETLASDPQLVQTPDLTVQVTITLTWSEVAGAIGYRVYRTVAPGDASGTELLLAEVDAPTLYYVDDGTVTPTGDSPLPLGALGQFAVLPTLGTAREGAGIAAAVDPDDPSTYYLYLLGGRDADGNLLADIERLEVTLESDGTQTPAADWVYGAVDIGTPRWQLSTFLADRVSAPDLITTSESWVYAGGGIAANLLDMVPEVFALKVAAGGALGEGTDERFEVESMNPYLAGYVAVTCANQLFAFGGNHANATTESFSAEMCGVRPGACDTGGGTTIPDPPELANWNNLSLNLSVARYLAAGTTVSAFIVVLGGIDDNDPPVPLSAVGKTLW